MVEVADLTGPIIASYDSAAPQATAERLRALWCRFEPKRMDVIKAEQRAQQETLGIPVPLLKSIGRELAKKYGEPPRVVHAISAHHEDIAPNSVLAVLVQAADTLSGARPGARRETLESYVRRLEELEKIASSFAGINKSYAIQAGRELRIIVESEKVSDGEAVLLARDVAKKIEESLSYPGQIKVTVIRETRAVGLAR